MQDSLRALVAPAHRRALLAAGDEPTLHQGDEAVPAPATAAAGRGGLRLCGAALLGVGLGLGLVGQAAAAPAACPKPGSVPASEIFDPLNDGDTITADNGTTTDPGTFVGTVGVSVGNICQIGIVGGITDDALINTTDDPSNYEFSWGGGYLIIEEEIGDSSFGGADAELDSLASESNTSPAALLVSITIPGNSNSPSGEYVLWNGGYLPSGYYTVSTYCSDIDCTTGDGTAVDPQFQINFLVPEPSSLAVLGVSLLGLGALARRRRA